MCRHGLVVRGRMLHQQYTVVLDPGGAGDDGVKYTWILIPRVLAAARKLAA